MMTCLPKTHLKFQPYLGFFYKLVLKVYKSLLSRTYFTHPPRS